MQNTKEKLKTELNKVIKNMEIFNIVIISNLLSSASSVPKEKIENFIQGNDELTNEESQELFDIQADLIYHYPNTEQFKKQIGKSNHLTD